MNTSNALALFWKLTPDIVLAVRNTYNRKIPSFTGTELNKLVHFWQSREVQN